LNGRDALPCVRNGKPKTDAEHRVPTDQVYTLNRIFFAAPYRRRDRNLWLAA